MPIGVEDQVDVLDELLRGLAHKPQSKASEIAQEHFQEARLCLLGAMYDEYAFDVELGCKAVNAIPDRSERAELRHVLSRLRAAGKEAVHR